MRRILRKIAGDEYGNLGDTSTLAGTSAVENLTENRMNRCAGEHAGTNEFIYRR
jgi:acetyl-CoA synthetase